MMERLVFLGLLVVSLSVQAMPMFQVEDLGLQSDLGYITSINSGGQYTGYKSNPDWSINYVAGTIGGSTHSIFGAGRSNSKATNINSSGEFVISSNYPDPNHSSISVNMNGTDINLLQAPNIGAASYSAINNSGQVAGFANTYIDPNNHDAGYTEQVVRVEVDGTISQLGVVQDFNSTHGAKVDGINSSGQIVGVTGGQHAFRTGSDDQIQDLGFVGVGGTVTGGTIINDSGTIAGQFQSADFSTGSFISDEYDNLIDIGNLGGQLEWGGTLYGTANFVTDINDSGQLLGLSYATNNKANGYLYDSVFGLLNINDLIMDMGPFDYIASTTAFWGDSIIGVGVMVDDITGEYVEHIVALRQVTSVSEPGSLGLMLLGFIGVVVSRRKSTAKSLIDS